MHKNPTSSTASHTGTTHKQHSGISNRESAQEETAERAEHPPVDTGSPPPENAGGDVGEQPIDDYSDRQTSHKAGSRSIAQKEAGSGIRIDRCPPRGRFRGPLERSPTRIHRKPRPSNKDQASRSPACREDDELVHASRRSPSAGQDAG